MRAVLILFLSIGVLFGERVSVEQLFNVKSVEVKKSTFGERSEYYGYAREDEKLVSHIVLYFDGYVQDIYANETFRYIKKGDLLFNIFSNELINAQVELLNAIKFKQDRTLKAAIDKLLLLGISKSIIEKIKREGEIIKSVPIYSPYSGIITQKSIDLGSSIRAGEMLYRVVELDNIWVVAKIYQSDIEKISKSSEVEVRFDGLKESFSGEIEQIIPYVNPQDKSVDVRISIENRDLKIFPNMFATINIFSQKREMLTLPKSAVLKKGDLLYVFKESEYEGEYEPYMIEAKRVSSTTYEILSGLEEGEVVVDKALFMFDSDAQINGLY